MSKKIVTFGEIMLRLATPGYQRITQASDFEVTYGGGEANVAVSLANYGFEAYFVTKLPPNEVGEACRNYIRRFGVHTDYINMGGERLGIYFLETGAAQRPSKVVYDRANSAISKVQKGEFDWATTFDGAELFHFTGITPALSDSAAEVTMEAVQAAKSAGVLVSCDLNFRKKLWSPEKANKVMSELMQYVDIAVGNEEDAEKVFGIKAENTDIHAGKLDDSGYREVAQKLVEKFDFQKVAITLRESYSAFDNGWSALLYDGKEFYNSRKYNIHVVDRVGGGDSFCGGLLYGLLSGMDNQTALNFAVAASCLKHSIPGDFNLVSKAEVENLMSGDGSGRVQR
ncbi:2-dehydro-3-deoxygluconokinase [Desulfotomaculum arcticum]|uniref:2-dehydro-3-deoxygluconokinase n=1 Tax=Desulfotruncus arcticus DSM 17038 TaxID=1121424 RepID=A0A1I2YJF6_9FIRM|nr:sugar kinase [Desulfotruncus arcticus]SFH24671.1 2-dehydro-3-deoxygluconokinase [Desulfotomaculum arcticum] [Desulfotruncus arcticus DSM 17038]